MRPSHSSLGFPLRSYTPSSSFTCSLTTPPPLTAFFPGMLLAEGHSDHFHPTLRFTGFRCLSGTLRSGSARIYDSPSGLTLRTLAVGFRVLKLRASAGNLATNPPGQRAAEDSAWLIVHRRCRFTIRLPCAFPTAGRAWSPACLAWGDAWTRCHGIPLRFVPQLAATLSTARRWLPLTAKLTGLQAFPFTTLLLLRVPAREPGFRGHY